MMDLDSAIQHCEEVAEEQKKEANEWHENQVRKCELFPFAEMDYTHENECKKCAEEHRQLAEWLGELKAYRDARAEINQAFNDDVRNDQNDYERGRKSGIFLCESIISVKLGESRSEIPNKSEIPTSCGDAISRQSAIFLASDLKQDLPDDERIANMVMAHNEGILEYQTQLSLLPSVTPQQRTGRWIPVGYDGYADGNPVYDWWECSECGWEHTGDEESLTAFCPNCGAKMEVEE